MGTSELKKLADCAFSLPLTLYVDIHRLSLPPSFFFPFFCTSDDGKPQQKSLRARY